MKSNIKIVFFALALNCFLAFAAHGQTSAFTYQGKLMDGASSAPTGTYDLQFALYDANGAAIGGATTIKEDVSVLNGVFAVSLDFGSTPFTSNTARTVEIGVRAGNSTGAFTVLAPRQEITSAPYAIRALNAGSVEATTAGNSVVNSINNAATNVTINSNRLPADIVRVKPAAAQSSASSVGGGGDAIINVAGSYSSSGAAYQSNFRINHNGGLVASGDLFGSVFSPPAEGAGTRLMWYPGKAAFRAGYVNGTQWNDANIGMYSTAFGENVRALGDNSLAAGKSSVAANTGTVALGEGNTATGANSIALGYGASTSTTAGSPRLGTFVFSDRSTAFTCPLYNNGVVDSYCQFNAEVTNAAHWRVANGFRIYTSSNLSTGVTFQSGAATSNWCNQENAVISTSTCAYLSTGGVWTNASSRDLKTNFAAVNTRLILRKVLSLPIQTWNYKSDGASIRHIGAVAQDFKQTFDFGDTDKAIGTVDADGVALAAIQGLSEEVNEQTTKLKTENERLRAQIAAQNKRLAAQAAQLSEFETRLKRVEQKDARPRRIINRRKK